MAEQNKVIWSEGMFLRHQHFQQEDRYVKRLAKQALTMLNSYPYGFKLFSLEQQHLSLGRIAVGDCAGIFPDGTVFDTRSDCETPAYFEVTDDLINRTLFLALPLEGAEALETASDTEQGLARYQAKSVQVRDVTSNDSEPVEMQVSALHLRILTDKDDLSQFTVLPIAKIIEKRSDGSVVLDAKFIPPCLDIQVSPVLHGFMQELQGLLHNRSEDLAARVTRPGAGGLSSMLDFLLLQMVNRHESFFQHLNKIENLHPLRFYEELIKFYGELTTVASVNKRQTEELDYRHDNLSASFTPVMSGLRQALSMVLEQTAIPLGLQTSKQGIRVALMEDKSLLNSANFVLAVKASMSNNSLRKQFPAQVKIGPIEKIRGLINIQLPGIALEPLSVAPPEIPYHAGFTYFQLDKSSQFWKHLANSSGFAFHISGEFPGLELEFWAIKSN